MRAAFHSLVLFAAGFAVSLASWAEEPAVSGAQARLDAAWGQFRSDLDEARTSLIDPAHFAPAPTERNLAEGHRYLLGHLGRLIEEEMRLDPRFPEFHRSVDMLRKHTGENPDAIYLKAPIDATGVYRVRGRVADPSEWASSKRVRGRAKAPRLVTFQTITGVPGDTGALAEMKRPARARRSTSSTASISRSTPRAASRSGSQRSDPRP